MRNPWLFLKRTLDFAAAACLLFLLSPLLLLLAAIVWADAGRPILFRQVRAGVRGRPFRIYKFRTMIRGAERAGLGVHTAETDPRLTRSGRWLRAWSLDELPQLLNILRGEMSFVGPRPTLPYQVERYDDRQRKRLLMRPGVTGWAQVNGRNSLAWPQRIELDVWYVEHWSPWLDLRILLRTPRVVLRREGIYGGDPDPISARETAAP